MFAGKWKAPKYVHCVLWSNPPKFIWTNWVNVAFYCTAVTLQRDPPSRSQWTDTMSFSLVPKWPAQHFISWPVVENIGTEQWWLNPYCWRSPAHTSVPCTATSLTSWPDRATSTMNSMNHALWTHTVQHLLFPTLCCGRLRIFVLSSSSVFHLKLKLHAVNTVFSLETVVERFKKMFVLSSCGWTFSAAAHLFITSHMSKLMRATLQRLYPFILVAFMFCPLWLKSTEAWSCSIYA